MKVLIGGHTAVGFDSQNPSSGEVDKQSRQKEGLPSIGGSQLGCTTGLEAAWPLVEPILESFGPWLLVRVMTKYDSNKHIKILVWLLGRAKISRILSDASNHGISTLNQVKINSKSRPLLLPRLIIPGEIVLPSTAKISIKA